MDSRHRNRNQTKPHPQTTPPSAARQSLRRLDRPGKNKALDGTRRHRHCAGRVSDPRAGGRYRIEMRSPDGKPHNVGGVYREVVANEKLVFTWAWDAAPPDEPYESLVTVLFKPEAGGTLLTITHEKLFDEASRDGHEHGWIGALDKLEKFVA